MQEKEKRIKGMIVRMIVMQNQKLELKLKHLSKLNIFFKEELNKVYFVIIIIIKESRKFTILLIKIVNVVSLKRLVNKV
jgi:hypothetical protein